MPNASAQSSNSNSRSYAAPGSGSSLVTVGSDRWKSGPLRHGDSVQKSSGPQTGGVTPMTCQNSGPLPPVLPSTGLITSGPLNSCGDTRKVSGLLESAGSMKLYNASIVHSQAVSNPDQENDYLLKGSLPKPILWSLVLLFVIGFVAGGFILAAVDIIILLFVVITIFGIVVVLSFWNTCFGRRAIIGFIA